MLSRSDSDVIVILLELLDIAIQTSYPGVRATAIRAARGLVRLYLVEPTEQPVDQPTDVG